jgi:hypothetical protein
MLALKISPRVGGIRPRNEYMLALKISPRGKENITPLHYTPTVMVGFSEAGAGGAAAATAGTSGSTTS